MQRWPLKAVRYFGDRKREVMVLKGWFLKPFNRRPVRLAAALLAIAVLGAVGLAGVSDTAESRDRTVRTEGSEQFVPNAKIMSTLRFTPGHNVISSGETLTLEHSDRTP